MKCTTPRSCGAALNVRVARKGDWENMTPDIESVIEKMDFRIFIGFEEQFNAYIARCLNTGAVAEGSTIEEAEAMIKQVLENDFRIAIQEGTLRSLLHDPAPWEATVRFYEMKALDPDGAREVPLAVSTGPVKRGVQSQVRVSERHGEASVA